MRGCRTGIRPSCGSAVPASVIPGRAGPRGMASASGPVTVISRRPRRRRRVSSADGGGADQAGRSKGPASSTGRSGSEEGKGDGGKRPTRTKRRPSGVALILLADELGNRTRRERLEEVSTKLKRSCPARRCARWSAARSTRRPAPARPRRPSTGCWTDARTGPGIGRSLSASSCRSPPGPADARKNLQRVCRGAGRTGSSHRRRRGRG